MKKINDQKKTDRYLKRFDILSHFSDKDLSFELYSFGKGEMITNFIEPNEYIQFVVSGTIRILNIRDSGKLFLINEGSNFTILGDMEFALPDSMPYLAECVTRTELLVLPLTGIRNRLENDPLFLRFLLKSVADKMQQASSFISEPDTLQEKLLYYMEHRCDGHILHGVEKAASSIQCSKRQLLRILKKLTDEGIVIKTEKGTYQLIRKTGN